MEQGGMSQKQDVGCLGSAAVQLSGFFKQEDMKKKEKERDCLDYMIFKRQ